MEMAGEEVLSVDKYADFKYFSTQNNTHFVLYEFNNRHFLSE